MARSCCPARPISLRESMYKNILIASAVVFAGLVGVALAGSAPDVADVASSSCHGSAEAQAESSGCHGSSASKSASRSVSRRSTRRLEARAARSEARAAALDCRAEAIEARAEAKAEVRSAKAAKSSCHGG